MTVVVNGEELSLSEGCLLSELLDRFDLGSLRVAVERNGAIVSSKDYSSTVLEEGDRLEIVRFVGGG